MITNEAYRQAACILGCEMAAIKAVAEVESSGNGFNADGTPKILFEPHIFWRELVKAGINPGNHLAGNEDILYQKQGSKPYGKYSAQHNRLAKAKKINEPCALKSASWGKFQIMGFNWELCDFLNLSDFINAMYLSEDEHLLAFVNFVKNNGLSDELQRKDWAAFARGYNGPSYKINKYDTKLADAYKKFL